MFFSWADGSLCFAHVCGMKIQFQFYFMEEYTGYSKAQLDKKNVLMFAYFLGEIFKPTFLFHQHVLAEIEKMAGVEKRRGTQRGVFRSFFNSLIVRDGRERYLFVPEFCVLQLGKNTPHFIVSKVSPRSRYFIIKLLF